MLFNILFKILVAFLGISISYVIHRLYHNYEAQKFFKKKAPHLFVREISNILAGNADLVLSRRNWKEADDAHKKYGRTVCFYYSDIPVVSTLDLDFIKKFAIDNANDHINRTIPHIPIDELEVDSIMFAEDEQWHRIRKALGPAFSLHNIKSPNVEREINEVIQEFIESLEWRLDKAEKEKNEQSIILDVEELSHRYSLALVFKSLYKQSYVVDFKARVDPVQHSIEKGYESFGMTKYIMQLNVMFPILRPLLKYLAMNFDQTGHTIRRIRGYVEQQSDLYFEAKRQITEAKKRNESGKLSLDEFNVKGRGIFRKNLLDYLIEKFAQGGLKEQEYVHSAIFLFFAADKTSADALSKIIYCLASNVNVQNKLRESILTEGLESKYLSWTLNEALRLYPPALIGCSRTITKDLESKDGIIPAGSFVITPTYTINRLKEYWGEDADEFKPERWANSKNFHPIQFLTFGAGKRSCPGKEFATHELKLLFSTLIPKLKFELTDRELHVDEFMAPFFVFNHAERPTWIKITRHKVPEIY